MERKNMPAAGEFYRHFKGKLYQIIGVAKHSETGEKMVVYQALYGDYGLYTRPLDMFMSPVDRVKYPAAEQTYRFEKVLPGKQEGLPEKQFVLPAEENRTKEKTVCQATERVSENLSVNLEESVSEEETVREEILRFLDAEGDTEKLEVLRSLRRTMDEQLLTTIELSLDMLPDEKESLERRYAFVERTLEQRIRFEGGRLR